MDDTQRKNPCGAVDCCQRKFDYSARVEFAREPTEAELAEDPGREQDIVDWHAHNDRVFAVHEAGHGIHALASGVGVEYIRCGTGDGNATYEDDSKFTGVDQFVNLLAGPAAGAIVDLHFGRYYHSVFRYIEKAREGSTGNCDGCRVVARLIKLMPDWSDEEVAEMYFRWWRRATTFFDSTRVRIALFAVAGALQRERLLTGKQVLALVNVEALREAREELDSPTA